MEGFVLTYLDRAGRPILLFVPSVQLSIRLVHSVRRWYVIVS